MKVSVIIAVYNTGQYLPQCLDSLLEQTYREWEAWCVDDGSSDDSWQILQAYATRDSRFHIIHFDHNAGQAKARNHAIRQQTGDLTAFLDSDDWLSPDGLEQVVRTFTEHPSTDCVLWNCQYVFPDRQEGYPMKTFDVLSGKEAFRLSLDWSIHGVYVTRADIHRRFLFDESAKWFSDDNTTRLHYYHSREVRCCEGTYYYRQRQDSVSRAVSIHHFDMLDAADSMRRQLKDIPADEETLCYFEGIRWYKFVDAYYYYYTHRREFTKAERQHIRTRLRQAWSTTDTHRLPAYQTRHIGYFRLPFWALQRLQENLYFMAKELMGR